MKQHTIIIYSSITALVVSAVFGLSVRARNADFKRTVTTALSASVNYDNDFIAMVDRLEKELATRASFGYEGGKDPMTGLVRQVVVPLREIVKPTVGGKKALSDTADKSQPAVAAPDPVDSIRLTAIIYDAETKNYTAVVMSGERSFSVNVGDRVTDRTIKSISDMAIVMESDSLMYRYDVSGKRSMAPRKK